VTRLHSGLPANPRHQTAPRSRRQVLRAVGAALPVAAFGTEAFAFSRQEMPAETAKLYRERCATDPVHAETLAGAFARLDAAGIAYDREEVARSLRCPLCGSNILSGLPDPTIAPREPSF